MNTTKLTFSQAVEGYELAAEARHLSSHTIADYKNTFRKFSKHLGKDLPLAEITSRHIKEFLAAQTTVTNKTCLNYHVGLSALWAWAVAEEIVAENIVRKVAAPDKEQRVIVPFSEADVQSLMSVLSRSRTYSRTGRRDSSHGLPNVERNRAIIMLMLDTGLRASELCEANIQDVDVRNRHIKVFGKGSKERYLPFSPRTGQALWRYLATRKDDEIDEPLFITTEGNRMDRSRLLKQINSLGERAGVPDCHPHRFRHTFAVQFLRNGGDTFALQDMLGHTTMEMVRVYLHLAQVDLDRAHKHASPVDNWKL